MKAQVTQQVRFSRVVQQCGKPEPVTLWTDPEKDAGFRQAMREHRVMTVKQENTGTRKDFGVIGFLRERGVAYLIFPKSLKAFSDHRVVGVKYDLLDRTAPADAVRVKEKKRTTPAEHLPASIQSEQQAEPVRAQRSAPPGKPRPAKQAKPSKPSIVLYAVTVRYQVVKEMTYRIRAATESEARSSALKKKVRFNASDAEATIDGVQPVK